MIDGLGGPASSQLLRQTLDGHVDLSLVRPEASHGMHISHHSFSTFCHADLPRVPEAVSCALSYLPDSGLYFRHVRPEHRRRRLCRVRVVLAHLVEHIRRYHASFELHYLFSSRLTCFVFYSALSATAAIRWTAQSRASYVRQPAFRCSSHLIIAGCSRRILADKRTWSP